MIKGASLGLGRGRVEGLAGQTGTQVGQNSWSDWLEGHSGWPEWHPGRQEWLSDGVEWQSGRLEQPAGQRQLPQKSPTW